MTSIEQLQQLLDQSPLCRQVLPLASMLRCCDQVNQLAIGQINHTQLNEALISSVLVLEPEQLLDVFPYPAPLFASAMGLRQLLSQRQQLQSKRVALGYCQEALQLSRIVLRKRQVQTNLRRQIETVLRFMSLNTQSHIGTDDHKQSTVIRPFALEQLDQTIISRLAGTYTETFSALRRRIMIHGDKTALQQQTMVHMIRSLLLSAVRFGVLWYQLGGRPWQLVFQRQRLLAATAQLEPLLLPFHAPLNAPNTPAKAQA